MERIMMVLVMMLCGESVSSEGRGRSSSSSGRSSRSEAHRVVTDREGPKGPLRAGGSGERAIERPVRQNKVDVRVAVSRAFMQRGPGAMRGNERVMRAIAVECRVNRGHGVAERAAHFGLGGGFGWWCTSETRELRDSERFLECAGQDTPTECGGAVSVD